MLTDKKDIVHICDIPDFMEYLSIIRHCKDSSLQKMQVNLYVIESWLKNKELTTRAFESFIYHKQKEGRKSNTLNGYISAYNSLINYFEYRDIPHSLKKFPSFKKTKPEIDILSPLEIKKLLSVIVKYGKFRGMDCSFLNITYPTFSTFLAVTGCRFTEASLIKVSDIDLINGVLRLKGDNVKYGDSRRIWIHEPLLGQLKTLCAMKNLDDYVFTNMMGKPLNPADYSFDLRKRARLAGITKRVHPHLFRHSYATQLLKDGVKIEYVTKLIGHKDIKTTYDNYVHLADDSLLEASKKHSLVREHQSPKIVLNDFYSKVIEHHFDPAWFDITFTQGSEISIRLKSSKDLAS